MRKRGKRYIKLKSEIENEKTYKIEDAIKQLHRLEQGKVEATQARLERVGEYLAREDDHYEEGQYFEDTNGYSNQSASVIIEGFSSSNSQDSVEQIILIDDQYSTEILDRLNSSETDQRTNPR